MRHRIRKRRHSPGCVSGGDHHWFSQKPSKTFLRPRRTQVAEGCLGALGNDEMFRLHGRREHVRVQVFCQLSWQHIRDRCKCWRRSGQKRTHLHPRFRQLICTILWEGGRKNKVKNINTHIQGLLQHFNRHQSSKEQKQLISKLTLKTWRLQWRACTLLSTTLTFHLLLVSIHLGLSIDFSHRLRLIARHFLTAVSGHIKMWIYVTNWKRKWWKYKSSHFHTPAHAQAS